MEDNQIPFFCVREESNELGISLPSCYSAYRLYCKRLGYLYCEEHKLRSLISAADKLKKGWFLARRRSMRSGNSVRKYVVFKLSALRQMEIWHKDAAPVANDNFSDLHNADTLKQANLQVKDFFTEPEPE